MIAVHTRMRSAQYRRGLLASVLQDGCQKGDIRALVVSVAQCTRRSRSVRAWRRPGAAEGTMARSGNKQPLNFAKLFYTNVHREFLPDLLKKHGDFLLRRSGGGRVLSVYNVREHIDRDGTKRSIGKVMHFMFAHNDKFYAFDEERSFPTLEDLINCYYMNGKPLNKIGTVLITPIYNSFDFIDSNRLQFKHELGKGNFGEVWEAMLVPERETVAIKILAGNTTEKDRAECVAEAKLMSMLQHPNVVRLMGLSFWQQVPGAHTRLLIVLEFCNYGSLEKLLEKKMVDDRGKMRALLDSAKGIAYLHSRDVIHRDIASRNCLVVNNDSRFTVKIADFGLSRLAPDHYELITKRRLPIYSTPADTLRIREWTSQSDVYSFGMLMYEVYNCGKNPYEQYFLEKKTLLKAVVAQMSTDWRLPPPSSMPPGLAEFALRCMKTAPERPTMAECVVFLKNFYDGMILP